ncbi:hemerythrin domain-containing protein [Silvimonas iriomotensis]|uniref:hemerythrin domain-containing protein n=1 Tax=Silvimonas iriomotensis TaxID=449662 RepID=UPI00166E06E7|nr:hemerythrin domain-containing protein [Silvimonas iriomotensis]
MFNRFSDQHAGFDDPVSLLLACHERVRYYLSLLQKLSAHHATHGSDEQARDAARAVLRYFDVAAPLHHQDEDDNLFALLRTRADPALSAHIDALAAEHPHLHRQWAALRVALMAIEQGGDAVLTRDQVEDFVGRYSQHAAREENAVYPHARTLLSEAEREDMGRQMAARRGVSAGTP